MLPGRERENLSYGGKSEPQIDPYFPCLTHQT